MMNLFQSFDDGADLFNNPIILNMMNQTVNTTNNTANPKNSKDGNTPGKTDVKAPPPKKTPADGAQNEPNVSTDTTGMPKSQHTSGTKSSAPPTGLLNMLLKMCIRDSHFYSLPLSSISDMTPSTIP